MPAFRQRCLKTSRFLVLVALISVWNETAAQTIPLSIREVLLRVEQNLPQLEAQRLQAEASKENIALAKNSLVPDLSIGYQANMATFNNITGMNYPGILLPISGPPSQNNDWNFIPGSGAGALLKWNPLTFGQRKAAIEKALAQFKQANASYDEQLFRHQYAAIQAYLEAAFLQKATRIAGAVADRYRVILQQSLVLAQTGLKPGIDTAQFQSAILQAEIEQLQTEKAYQEKLVELSGWIGLKENATLLLLTDTVPRINGVMPDSLQVEKHPLYKSIQSQKAVTLAAYKEQQKAWRPQLDIWGNLYGRGSGVDENGVINRSEGWALSRTNAGVGFQLSFPILQFSKVAIRKKQLDMALRSDEARLLQAQLDISKQVERATTQYRQDLLIAGKTPLQLKIAGEVYNGLKISYEAGLIDYTRLYQSQYELIRAEINDAHAQMQVWRSLLAIAVAKGDLSSFIAPLN